MGFKEKVKKAKMLREQYEHLCNEIILDNGGTIARADNGKEGYDIGYEVEARFDPAIDGIILRAIASKGVNDLPERLTGFSLILSRVDMVKLSYFVKDSYKRYILSDYPKD